MQVRMTQVLQDRSHKPGPARYPAEPSAFQAFPAHASRLMPFSQKVSPPKQHRIQRFRKEKLPVAAAGPDRGFVKRPEPFPKSLCVLLFITRRIAGADLQLVIPQ